jgi:thermopsin
MRAVQKLILGALVVAVAVMVVPLSSGTMSAHTPTAHAVSTTGSVMPIQTRSGGAAAAAFEQKVLATAKSDHLPLEAVSLPNLLGSSTVSNGVVTPNTVSPAPMGLGFYGVRNTTGTASAFSLETQSWQGTITLNNINTFLLTNDGTLSTNGSQNTFGVQLNAVTNGTTVQSASDYNFWTQNVLYFNFPVPGYITFLDNVWNFSSPAVSLTAGTLYSYNGTPVYPQYYYDFGPSFPVSFPVTIHLYLNSSITNDLSTGYGYTTVRFGYDVVNANTGISEEAGVYDTVEFNSTTPIGSVPQSPFLVDGSQVTPTGFIPFDAEIIIGGPGGGTTTSVYGISGSESLSYWNGSTSAYDLAPSAWNVGGETGETSEGISETYTTAGTVDLSTGPSIVAPLWNSTPGGNIGQATIHGPLSPSNAFIFFTPGSGFNANTAVWAPTQTASTFSYVVPPGTYTLDAMMSDFTPIQATVSPGIGGQATLHFVMTRNFAEGVYTPLFAWNNAQLAAISFGGFGTPFFPYFIDNNPAHGGLNPVFGEFNDYLYPVFPGVLIAGTTAYTDLDRPSLLNVTYQTSYDATLSFFGLPLSNNLAFQIFDASHVSIWGARGISGWFFYEDYGPSGLLPLANVVIWGGTHDLVGDNTFLSQGSSLVLAGYPNGPTGNVVWGNTFENSTVLAPTMYPGNGAVNGPPIAIFAFEAGDLIYNNWVGTSITAYAPNVNMFTGAPQLNLENWNLPMVEPAFYGQLFNGHLLIGTIVHSAWQGGNFWADYIPGSPLPYDEYGFIAAGGDYFPYPIVAYAVTFALFETGPPVTWSVTLNGVTQTTSGRAIVFFETPGTYAFTDQVVAGSGTITPSSGTVTVSTHNQVVPLTLHR